MTITVEQVWNWMGASSRREGQGDADSNMGRIVTAIEELWLDQWAPAIADIAVTITESDNLITAVNHHLTDTTPVTFSTLTDGAPLTTRTTLFVCDATADTFKLALTSGGAAIDITSSGTGRIWTGPRPTYIDQALIMQASALYNRRTILNGVVAGTTELGPFRVGRFDPDIQRLLDPGGWAVG